MRRARYLAGDSAPRERSIARDWMCGLAIPTRTCAPAWHAGRSTNDCGDHPTPERQYWRALSTTSTLECMTWKGERRCRNGPRIRAQLRSQDKSPWQSSSACQSQKKLYRNRKRQPCARLCWRRLSGPFNQFSVYAEDLLPVFRLFLGARRTKMRHSACRRICLCPAERSWAFTVRETICVHWPGTSSTS